MLAALVCGALFFAGCNSAIAVDAQERETFDDCGIPMESRNNFSRKWEMDTVDYLLEDGEVKVTVLDQGMQDDIEPVIHEENGIVYISYNFSMRDPDDEIPPPIVKELNFSFTPASAPIRGVLFVPISDTVNWPKHFAK